MKSFISTQSLGRTDLESLVADASAMRDHLELGEMVTPILAGSCVANVFFEPSTRTRLSFDLAAQRLGAHVITLHPDSSSTAKGESLRDTVLTVAAIGADILVVRHSEAGVPQAVAEWTGLPVINAGDGTNEHPTQALLDAVTLQRHFGRIEGLSIAIVGDIVHSRVAGSLVHTLSALGAEVRLVGPSYWLPDSSELQAHTDLDEVVGQMDVVYLLRVQTERGGVIDDRYIADFTLDKSRASKMAEAAVVMHPGPMNRGVEIAEEVAESPRALMTEQVRNGVPCRMAVLEAVRRGGT